MKELIFSAAIFVNFIVFLGNLGFTVQFYLLYRDSRHFFKKSLGVGVLGDIHKSTYQSHRRAFYVCCVNTIQSAMLLYLLWKFL